MLGGGSQTSQPGTPGSFAGTSRSLNSTCSMGMSMSMGGPGTPGRVSTGASTAPSQSDVISKTKGKGSLDMSGFVLKEEYDELQQVNAALREKNKELHAQLGSLKVEHEMLRMNEMFLCDQMNVMGLEPLTCA